MNNKYPVKFQDFERIIAVHSGHLVFYTILDDRIHFEMPTENGTFITQKFLKEIQEGKEKFILQEPIKVFLTQTLGQRTSYRYYLPKEMEYELKNIKLYTSLVTTSCSDTYDYTKELEEVENDNSVEVYQENQKIMEFEKR